MWISVKSYHRLRRYTNHLPADGRMTVPEGITAAQVMELLQIPGILQADTLLFANGRPLAPDRVLKPGDSLALLEPVAGG